MAPALTAEPLSSKEKLTSTASPATGTRQSVRKLESPSGGGGGGGVGSATSEAALIKKPTVAATATSTTRVTRSKDAAKRTVSPPVHLAAVNNNKRKSNNNNNLHSNNNSNINSEVPASNDQMGLSAATTHTSSSRSSSSNNNNNNNNNNNDGSATASSSSSSGNSDATAVAAVPAERNNNCKEGNSTAELLANLTSEFEEAITAEICLRKTLPEVSLSKEQPATAAAATAVSMSMSMADEADAQSTSGAAAATVETSTVPAPSATTTPAGSITAEPQREVAFASVENTSLRLDDPDNIEVLLVFLQPAKSDCYELDEQQRIDGIYKFLEPELNEVQRDFNERHCVFASDGGPAWTVIQQRSSNVNNWVRFNRSWDEYRAGFGHLAKDFWFGNAFIHRIVYRDDYVLRIELQDHNGVAVWAEYGLFRLDSESYNYQLVIGEPHVNSTANDALTAHNCTDFQAYDRTEATDCDGWWFDQCFEDGKNKSNLNGHHITWGNWHNEFTLDASRMMIRPRNIESLNNGGEFYEED